MPEVKGVHVHLGIGRGFRWRVINWPTHRAPMCSRPGCRRAGDPVVETTRSALKSHQPGEPAPGAKPRNLDDPSAVYKPGDSSTHHPDETIRHGSGLLSPVRASPRLRSKAQANPDVRRWWSTSPVTHPPGRARAPDAKPARRRTIWSRSLQARGASISLPTVNCIAGAATHHV